MERPQCRVLIERPGQVIRNPFEQLGMRASVVPTSHGDKKRVVLQLFELEGSQAFDQCAVNGLALKGQAQPHKLEVRDSPESVVSGPGGMFAFTLGCNSRSSVLVVNDITPAGRQEVLARVS